MSLINASRWRPAPSTRSSGSVSCFQRLRILAQHLGDADDRVERGAQLMAHIGKKLRLVLARLGELTALILDFIEQPHVLERNNRLVGKGRDKLDLLVTEGPYSFAAQNDNPDRGSFSQKGYPEHGVEPPCLVIPTMVYPESA